jgi:hypothetical protein
MEVMENHEVRRIIVENDVAAGVEVVPTGTQGPRERIEASVVVASTGPVATFGELISADVMEKHARLQVTARSWEWEHMSLFGCHLALRRRPQFKAEQYDPGLRRRRLVANIGAVR